MPDNIRRNRAYGINNALQKLNTLPVIARRNPTANDKRFPLATNWINETTSEVWTLTRILAGNAVWTLLSAGGVSVVDTLTGDAGGPVGPDGANNINVLGGSGVTITGNPGTNTVTVDADAGAAISKYIVDADGSADYTTIQAALDAANAIGLPATVVVRPGTYTENLVLYDTIDIFGNLYSGVNIVGTHTPPASGRVMIQDCTLSSATDIFNSAVAGTAAISIEDAFTNVTNGFVFNLPNWTGSLSLFLTGNLGTNDGCINNAGGAAIDIVVSEAGIGTGQTMVTTGAVTMKQATVGCPIDFQTGTVFNIFGSDLSRTVTLSNDSTGIISESKFVTGATAAISQGSTGILELSDVTVDSSASPVITGAGAGAIDFGNMVYFDSSVIAATVTQTYTRTTNRNTPYVAGPTGNFATIQAALDAATTTGLPEIVYVQAGTYAENLTLYTLVDIVGSSYSDVTITGVHTPPAAGAMTIRNCTLASATDIFNSAAAGTADLAIEDCFTNVTNGFVFNLANWTGPLSLFLTGNLGTNDGCINNTGGSAIDLVVAEVGAGTGQTMVTTGAVTMKQATVDCPIDFQTGTVFNIFGSDLSRTVTLSNDSTGIIIDSSFSTGATSAIVQSSTGVLSLTNLTIDSSNANVIAGAGAGIVDIGSIDFVQNSGIAATVTQTYMRTTNRNTPYVAGPTGNFATVQAALDAATTTGLPEIVYVQAGIYAENLTLYTLVDIVGASFSEVTITGAHTPPAAGAMTIRNCTLTSLTDIFTSIVAGTAALTLEDCETNVTNGFVFDLLNWTGPLSLFLTGNLGTNDGCVNNTGGSAIDLVVAEVGAGTGQTMVTTGAVTMKQATVDCPIDFQTGTVFNIFGSDLSRTVTLSNDSTGIISESKLVTGATAAISQGSTGILELSDVTIDSSASPVITGAGAGAVDFGNVSYLDISVVAATVTQTFARTTNRNTPYVAGPTGNFATIQAALDAATTTGLPEIVYVQAGAYTENLTLYTLVDIVGASFSQVTITGAHTPPAAGAMTIRNCTLASATDIFTSAVAGTTALTLEDCETNVTNGFVFDLANWTGPLSLFLTGNLGTNDGCINNTGGSAIDLVVAEVGAGTGQTMVTTGAVTMKQATVDCPIDFQTGTVFNIFGSDLSRTVTLSNDSTGIISESKFATGATAAISQGSTGILTLSQVTIDSSNATPIGGAGAGAVDLGNINFVQNSGIAATVTQTYMRATDRISPYVVGATGNFATIQAALDAANASGATQTVYLQPGIYTESLTLYGDVDIKGTIYDNTTITGVHTPPASGRFTFQNLTLTSPTDIFNSAAAGTTVLTIDNCIINCTNGYTFNLLNWTGDLFIYDSTDVSTDNGFLNNTGGSDVISYSCILGAGNANALTASNGAIIFRRVDLLAPATFGGTAFVDCQHCSFFDTHTFSANATLLSVNTHYFTSPNQCITQSSAGALEFDCVFFNTSSGNAITGAGAGTVTLGTVDFSGGKVIAGTVTQAYNASVGRVSPYVVGPTGNFGTIQAALDAANATAIPQTVIIQAGAYTEDLTLYDNINIRGNSYIDVIINGTHTPPTSGSFLIQNCTLADATDIFNSAAAGTADLAIEDCETNVTNGFVFNLANWTGSLSLFLTGNLGTNDGCINNTGGSAIDLVVAEVGAGTGQTMVTTGVVTMKQATVDCPIDFQTGTVFNIFGSDLSRTVTLSNDSTGIISESKLVTGATAAISQGSTGVLTLSNLTIDSSNANAIAGAGAGVITLGSITFEDSAVIAGALTLSNVPKLSSGGLAITEGANAQMGVATLVAGTLTVNTTAVTANSRIFLTHQTNAGTPDFVSVTARVVATSFTITSGNALDTSIIAWMIVEPN